MLVDIVILPPLSLRKLIGKKVSQVIRKYPHEFVVDNRKLIPHMSLFHLRTSKSKLALVVAAVRRIIKDYEPQKIRSLGFQSSDAYVGFPLSNNRVLMKLNKQIVNVCYKLRTGSMPWTPNRKPFAWEARNRRIYGTQHNIGKSFQPHLTMGWLKNSKDASLVAQQIRGFRFEFVGNVIAICEVNYWHQVTRIIKKFEVS